MPVRGTDFVFSVIILLDFRIITTVWYRLFFIIWFILKKRSLNSDFQQNEQLPITLKKHRT